MSTRVVLATKSRDKLTEMRDILAEAGLDVELLGADAFPDLPEVRETGLSFAENSALKARSAAEFTGLAAIADDSGLTVEAMGGMPGIFSARWAGKHGDDVANRQLLLAQLADIPDDQLGAAFVCAATVALPDGSIRSVQAQMQGQLTRHERGENGFGYDPIFVPDGYQRTNAELTSGQKNAISHRGKAMREIAELLKEWGR